jgi:hypothetical protein
LSLSNFTNIIWPSSLCMLGTPVKTAKALFFDL